MLGQRYKELDAELGKARQRVAELLEEYDEAHTEAVGLKATYKVQFAKEYNLRTSLTVEGRKQVAEEECGSISLAEATAKARADVLREYLNAARDDVKAILQQMTNAQSVGAFAREEMKL